MSLGTNRLFVRGSRVCTSNDPLAMQLTEEDVDRYKVGVRPEVKTKANVALTVVLHKQLKIEFDFGAAFAM